MNQKCSGHGYANVVPGLGRCFNRLISRMERTGGDRRAGICRRGCKAARHLSRFRRETASTDDQTASISSVLNGFRDRFVPGRTVSEVPNVKNGDIRLARSDQSIARRRLPSYIARINPREVLEPPRRPVRLSTIVPANRAGRSLLRRLYCRVHSPPLFGVPSRSAQATISFRP